METICQFVLDLLRDLKVYIRGDCGSEQFAACLVMYLLVPIELEGDII